MIPPDLLELAAQFLRYAVCGFIATATDAAVFYLLALRVWPALRADDPVVRRWRLQVRPVEERQRAARFLLNNAVAFIASNLVGYALNTAFVFTRGRHPRALEIALFFAVSAASMAAGSFTGWALIRGAGWGTTPAYAAKIAASLLMNFAGRKWIVFLR
ncbi:MAG: GtrA family protein [Kiritimatiellae bacterium]|nr:GtrA family protein [Kiritimatiellia bacterium]